MLHYFNDANHETKKLHRIKVKTKSRRIKKKLIKRIHYISLHTVTDHHFDKFGKPISLFLFSKLMNDSKYKIIKQDSLDNGLLISTVWLGLNYSFGGGQPLIFETMVFNNGDNTELPDAEVLDRYVSKSEASERHKRFVDHFSKLI